MLAYVIPLTLVGAVLGLLLGISLACWQRHGKLAGLLAFLTPIFVALMGFGMGAAAAPESHETPDFSGVTWGLFGELIGFVGSLLLVVVAGFTNWLGRRPPGTRPSIDMPGIRGPDDDK